MHRDDLSFIVHRLGVGLRACMRPSQHRKVSPQESGPAEWALCLRLRVPILVSAFHDRVRFHVRTRPFAVRYVHVPDSTGSEDPIRRFPSRLRRHRRRVLPRLLRHWDLLGPLFLVCTRAGDLLRWTVRFPDPSASSSTSRSSPSFEPRLSRASLSLQPRSCGFPACAVTLRSFGPWRTCLVLCSRARPSPPSRLFRGATGLPQLFFDAWHAPSRLVAVAKARRCAAMCVRARARTPPNESSTCFSSPTS